MDVFFLSIAVTLCIMMLLALYRAILGPTAIDRIMGVNVIGTKTTVLLVLIGMLEISRRLFNSLPAGLL